MRRVRRATEEGVVSGRTKAQLLERIAELEADVGRLGELLDPTTTLQDIEMKIHRGEALATMRIGHGDGHATPGIRLLAAIALNALMGPERVEPENYRAWHLEITPAGTFQPWRISFEVVKPGGRTSHEIRQELEAKLAKGGAP